jgi:hypothetical protein
MRRTFVLAVAVALALSACGADPRTGATDSVGSTVAPVVPVGSGDPSTAPDALRFSAPVVGGGTLDLATYAGQTVAFWFWAPT